jgi:hypothetical protein
MKDYYKPGTYNAICDRCGLQFKADELKKEWTGLMVCEADWELRNPQDLIKVPKEVQAVPWARPEPADTFTSVTFRPINTTTKDVTPP